MSLAIRQMLESDLPVVLAIQAECYEERKRESLAAFLTKVEGSPGTCFVAEIEPHVVGYLVAVPIRFEEPPRLNAQTFQTPADADSLYLHDLAVVPAARRSGAARQLVEAFFVRIRALNLSRGCLTAVQQSAPYWSRHGFRTVTITEPIRDRLATYGADAEYMDWVRAP